LPQANFPFGQGARLLWGAGRTAWRDKHLNGMILNGAEICALILRKKIRSAQIGDAMRRIKIKLDMQVN
jgi:hypothetical protein